jgi:hypothetical protein
MTSSLLNDFDVSAVGEVEQMLGVDEVVVAVGAGLRSVARADGPQNPASNAGHAAV